MIAFENGVSLSSEKIGKTAEKALQTIKSELPEDAQTYEIYEMILSKCKDKLQGALITL